MLLDDMGRAPKNNIRHAGMRAYGRGIKNRLAAEFLNTLVMVGIVALETKFAGNDLFRKIAVTDKQRHDKNSGGKRSPKHTCNTGLLFPKTLQDPTEDGTAANLIGVLVSRSGRIRI